MLSIPLVKAAYYYTNKTEMNIEPYFLEKNTYMIIDINLIILYPKYSGAVDWASLFYPYRTQVLYLKKIFNFPSMAHVMITDIRFEHKCPILEIIVFVTALSNTTWYHLTIRFS